MMIFHVISHFSTPLIAIFATIVATVMIEMSRKPKKLDKDSYRFLVDENYPYLHGTEYLRELLLPLKKTKNKEVAREGARCIVKHIERHKVNGSKNYRILLAHIRKTFDGLAEADELLKRDW